MRAFACDNCGLLVTFESSTCVRCEARLAFAWPERELRAFPDAPPPRCANAAIAACNWSPDHDGQLCFSCTLTRTRPPDHDQAGLQAFAKAEAAKRRLLFELGELALPIPARAHGNGQGLAFDLLSSQYETVTTGHADGLITLDLAEADVAHSAQVQKEMGEPYRTLLGHFRHEVGHFYFGVLTAGDDAHLARARTVFGDERADYQQALERHYSQGPPPDWPERFVSAYASMHPSEDWAETFAHLVHMRDTLQTAATHGVTVTGPALGELDPAQISAPQLVQDADLRTLLSDWVALGYALNEINRSMGHEDLYPFVLSPPVIEKLACVDELVTASARRALPPAR
ncbi:MAG TPA: putative zinc-binding metallopeptidase [Thermoleophilaceae bacterium]